MEYILRTNTVSKKYTNYYAVDKVSISIKKGEIYGLIGENGAGKSTLMKMIAGLVEPSEGSVELFGNFVPQTERYRIGCVIESPALYAELTAKQNLEVFRKAYGLSSKESVQQILKQVGLSQYENKIVKKFSLGMKQRLAIASALLNDPEILILDEPTNGLDPQGIHQVRDIIRLIASQGTTILLASHLLDEVEKVCSHVLVLRFGKILYNGKVDEMVSHNAYFELQSNNNQQLIEVLKNHPELDNYENNEEKIIAHFKTQVDSAELNGFFFEKGISLNHLVKRKQSLEEQFLTLTNSTETQS